MGKKKDEILYTALKAGISLIPIAGAPANELLSLILIPPVEKRQNAWIEDVGQRLKQLEEENNFDLSKLLDDQVFIDTVLNISQKAILTSEEEKLKYYQNLILNTVIFEKVDKSEIQVFVNLVSSFTLWHIRLLQLFNDPQYWFSQLDLPVPNLMSGSLYSIVEIAFPELSQRKDFCNLVWDDLKRSGLHNSGDLNSMISASGLMVRRTTDLGRKFLEFIKNR